MISSLVIGVGKGTTCKDIGGKRLSRGSLLTATGTVDTADKLSLFVLARCRQVLHDVQLVAIHK